MLKFRCQHCGQRIAVPKSHLGRLVTCSECGAQTHPLAEQLAASAPPAASAPTEPTKTAASTAVAATCGNCGGAIGRLQSSHAWEGHTVCGACLPRLVGDSKLARRAAVGPEAPAALVTRVRREQAGDYAAPSAAPPPPKPLGVEVRERVLRALVVFVVASVALYGALTLLRDVAGLIAVAAVAVLALLALYGLFRGTLAARRRMTQTAALVAQRET